MAGDPLLPGDPLPLEELLLPEELLPPPELWDACVPPQLLATQAGVLELTGAEAETAGLVDAEPTCTVPAELLADWLPGAWLWPPLVDALLPAGCWLAPLPEQSLATQTGALPFTGTEADAAGSTVAEPTCTVPAELLADWLPELWPWPPLVDALLPAGCWLAPLPEQSLATQTGAFPFTGTEDDAAGLADAEPTCTVPADALADWSPDWPGPLFVAEEALPDDCVAELPEQLLATQTGALAFTGAVAETAGLTVAEPTCTVPAELDADWFPASAGAAVASATRTTQTTTTRFTSFPPFERIGLTSRPPTGADGESAVVPLYPGRSWKTWRASGRAISSTGRSHRPASEATSKPNAARSATSATPEPEPPEPAMRLNEPPLGAAALEIAPPTLAFCGLRVR